MKKRFNLVAMVIMMALSFMTGALFGPTTASTSEQNSLLGNRWSINQAGDYEILTDPDYKVAGEPVMAPAERGWRFTVVAR